jgi:hypothetical protein
MVITERAYGNSLQQAEGNLPGVLKSQYKINSYSDCMYISLE